MATLYTHKTANIWKTWGLLGMFLVLIIGFGFFLSQYFGDPSILYIAVIFALIMNVASYWWSDKIALSFAHAKELPFDADPELHRIVENLAITAGLPKPRVYLIEDPAPNAFATGRDPAHAAVAVTSGLRSMLERVELEGVIAHELAHIGNRDILISTVVVVLAGILSIASDIALRTLVWGGDGGRDRRAGHPIVLVIGLVLMLLAPLAATLIRLSVSRKREFLADATGALMTRYPEGLASALKKISSFSSPMRHANNATAHLFISNPFGARALRGVAHLFMTHPPTEDRIAALLGKERS